MSALVEIAGLDVGIGERGPAILAAIDLTIAPGEVVGIVGESGSGKSMLALTLMDLLPAPLRRRAGAMRFAGADLAALPPSGRRALRGREMAMIFQEPMTSLNPIMRVGAQIEEAAARTGASDTRARTLELLRAVEMPDPPARARAYPHELSGGMRQRAMIAMALAGAPKLLIADEPTTALDVTIQAQILELLARVQARTGMAMMLITHDLGVIAETCDRVGVLYAGRIVEAAPARDLFDRPAHPYTAGLLAARPRLGPRTERLVTIEGAVPPPGADLPGCRYAPRCARRIARCEQTPPLEPAGGARAVACWRPLTEDAP